LSTVRRPVQVSGPATHGEKTKTSIWPSNSQRQEESNHC
jgi:gag-polypeptide of LTR copia-type